LQKGLGRLFIQSFFAQLGFESLKQFLSRDDLSVSSEAVVLDAVVTWLTADKNNRKHYLDELLHSVRFAFMDTEDLFHKVHKSELLRSSKVIWELLNNALFYKLGNLEGISLGGLIHPQRRKSICLTVNRGGEISRTANWYHNGASADAIDIIVDKPVTIAGIGLLGGNGEYLVDVELRLGTKTLYKKTTTFYSVDTSVQPIFFDKKIRLIPKKQYTCKATISGGKTYFIDLGGRCSVTCGEVNFSFQDSLASTNGTDIRQGQIPEIYFFPY